MPRRPRDLRVTVDDPPSAQRSKLKAQISAMVTKCAGMFGIPPDRIRQDLYGRFGTIDALQIDELSLQKDLLKQAIIERRYFASS